MIKLDMDKEKMNTLCDKKRRDEEDDVHICGLCRAQFSDVELFIQHKKTKCPVRLARQQEVQSSNVRQSTPQSMQEAPVEQYAQTLLADVDNTNTNIQDSTVDGSNTVEISQCGESLGYFPVLDAQTADTAMGQITQHQYVILPCASEDGSLVSSQVDQSGTQTYSTLETVYTLTSHAPVQTTSQVESSLHEPVNYKKSSQTLQQINFSTSSSFFDPVNQRILDQTSDSDCIPTETIQEPMCYETQEDNLQPVNYSKNNAEPQNQSAVLELLQNNKQDQIIIQDLNSFTLQNSDNVTNLNFQQQIDMTANVSFQPTGSMTETVETQALPRNLENRSILQEHLMGKSVKIAGKIAKPKFLIENVHNMKGAKIVTVRGKHGLKSPDTAKFEYTISDHEQVDKTLNAKPSKKKKRAPLEKKFKCQIESCSFKTAYIKDLERHSRTHTGEKPYQCTECQKMFSRSDKLTLHMRYHSDDRVFKCNFCDYSCVENGSLKKHMKTHLDERPFSCQVCPYKSRSSSQLAIHLRTHTGDTPYSCRSCDAVFKVSSDLQRHIRIHTGEKPHACEYEGCDYRCAVKSNLKSHYKTHHSTQMDNACSLCDFMSSSKKALFEHKKMHDSNPDLTCATCKYQCSNKSALRNHMRIHGDIQKYSCNFCEYKAVQLGNVQAHMKRKHPSKVPKRFSRRKKNDKNNQAVIASKVQEVSEEPEKGEKKPYTRGKIHPKCQQNFKCDRCPAAFVREDSLKCHLKQHSDSSLSTAYAVLNLQQPVINTSLSQSNKNQSEVDSSTAAESGESTNVRENQNNTSLSRDTAGSVQNFESENSTSQGQILSGQGQMLQSQGQMATSQSVSLGINDILVAAGMSGINSSGNSPNSKLTVTGENIGPQDIALNNSTSQNSGFRITPPIPNSRNQTRIPNTVLGQSSQDVPSIQVMQNISLPYIRLPNGQVLIITDQRSMNITNQEGSVLSDSGVNIGMNEVQSQLLNQPMLEIPNQPIQCAADSTVPTPPPPQISASHPQGATLTQPGVLSGQDGSIPQQQGAIPIQIILPSDSQQAVPLVSQLLNSVLNRGSGNNSSQNQGSMILQGLNQNSGSDTVQNFVLQIPSQAGNTGGNMAESQSFVLQIPGPSSIN